MSTDTAIVRQSSQYITLLNMLQSTPAEHRTKMLACAIIGQKLRGMNLPVPLHCALHVGTGSLLSFDADSSGLCIVTWSGRFLAANRTMSQLFGTTHEQLLRTPVRQCYADPSERRNVLHHIQRRGYIDSLPMMLRQANGKARAIRLSVVPITVGSHRLLITAIRDWTQTSLHRVWQELDLVPERVRVIG